LGGARKGRLPPIFSPLAPEFGLSGIVEKPQGDRGPARPTKRFSPGPRRGGEVPPEKKRHVRGPTKKNSSHPGILPKSFPPRRGGPLNKKQKKKTGPGPAGLLTAQKKRPPVPGKGKKKKKKKNYSFGRVLLLGAGGQEKTFPLFGQGGQSPGGTGGFFFFVIFSRRHTSSKNGAPGPAR